MSEENLPENTPGPVNEIPQSVTPYPITYPVLSDYNIIRFSNKGKATIDDYEIFRYLEDLWIYYEGTNPYIFNGCVYVQITDRHVADYIYNAVNDSISGFPGEKPLLKESRVNDIIKMYSSTRTVEKLPEPPGGASELADYDSEVGLAAFLNGILKLDSFEFLPFTPYVFITFQVQAMYNPAITEHKVDKVYRNIIPDDATRETFYRMAGYTIFSPKLLTPGIFMLYGGGETGKTSLQKAITNLMSSYSYSSLTMLDLADKYAPANLEGKRANFCGEADGRSSAETKISGGMIKDISEGDENKKFTVQKKFHQPHDIVSTAKLWFCSNVMPDFGDQTSGLYRRMYIIPCRVKQNWDDQIQYTMALPEARSWFANKCLNAYMDFLADGNKIIATPDMKVELTSYMMQDNLMEFLMAELGVINDKAKIAEMLEGRSTTEFYTKYEAYCRTQGARPLKSARFQEKIRNEYNLENKTRSLRLEGGIQTSRTTYNRRA